MECKFSAISADPDEFREIFESVKTIAIPGLSPKEDKDSHKVAKYLQSKGYKIIPIYPKGEMILGEKVYRSLDEITDKIDMINMFRKAEAADLIVDFIEKRDDVRILWLQKGIVNDKAAKRAISLGLKVVQNRCTMIEHRRIFS